MVSKDNITDESARHNRKGGRNITGKSLKALYTNADQLLNKMEDLKMDIVSREPDVIIIQGRTQGGGGRTGCAPPLGG